MIFSIIILESRSKSDQSSGSRRKNIRSRR